MPTEPDIKRTIVFVDGQNLFYAAQECLRRISGSNIANRC